MICIPITENTINKAIADMKKASKIADILELRIDYIKDINEKNLERLLKNKNGKVVVTNRKKSEGGKSNLSEIKRINLLKKAIEFGADFVDVELSIGKKSLKNIIKNKKKTKIICSHHDFKKTPNNLFKIYKKIKKTKCDVIKIVTFAKSINDNFRIFELLKKADKKIIAMCMGELGKISRVLNQKYGSMLTFASIEKGKESAPGQITAKELIDAYRIKKINKNTKILTLIGNPVEHSIFHLLANGAFDKLGVNFVYVKIKVDDLAKFMKNFRKYFYGAGVTIPHKVGIMKHLNKIDKTAKRIGAVNTIVNRNGKLMGYNTDCEGAIMALKKKTELRNKKIAVLGAGGAARAVCYGLKKENARIIILNRTVNKAKRLANELKCKYGDLKRIENIDFDILINTTSIGMSPNINKSLVEKKYLKNKIVFDVVYNPLKTKLLKDAESQGSQIINGLDMLVYQGILQFKLWTGKDASFGLIKNIAVKNI